MKFAGIPKLGLGNERGVGNEWLALPCRLGLAEFHSAPAERRIN